MAAVTAFGLGGGIWRPLDISLFANKNEAVVAAPDIILESGREGGAYGGYQSAMRRKKRIKEDDEEFMQMAKVALAEIIKHL